MREVKCDNTTCQWNKKRKCVCRYRFTTKTKTTNKGK